MTVPVLPTTAGATKVRQKRRHHPVVRITHWVSALALVIMVFAVDPYAIRAMTTGGYDEDRFSPEARNARPFVHLGPAHPEKTAAPESVK